MDADAVSRLLKCGEVPEYHDADTLEWDKGPVTEEEMQVARDLADKRTRRMQRAELRLLLKRKDQHEEGVRELPEVIVSGLRSGRRGTTSSRQLRPRVEKVPVQRVRTAPGRDNFDDVVPNEAVLDIQRARRCGFNRVVVAPSTITTAGQGLFLKSGKVKAGGLVTSYEGDKLTQEQVDEEGRDLSYVYSDGRDKLGNVRYVDAIRSNSCYGRYCNDPRDDSLVNAKVMLKGGRLVVMATVDIQEGDEIFIDYGLEYWLDRLSLLTPEAAAEVWDRATRMGLKVDEVRPKGKRMKRETWMLSRQ
jgi:hypothetical protein